ncbi:hypothetical protein KBK19_04955 [Microvirga sp. STR05]|uniref:TerB family tellurite resistance protein n=1 Tax=Hymenobacter duratus TaxID=2771356 RepID=A0ABR8JC75_9BACT|nr:hypothetical protein [Hymenobacter duratus]MBD2714379.1 hypothetical protein [Hymenobacter duratus]MBR7949282.1 hypothetical protein [Microvirga sp. STR05]
MENFTPSISVSSQVTHSLLARLLALAYVDQEVDLREVELIYGIALERGVSKETLESIMLRPHSVSTILPSTPHERVSHLYDLARLILADGIIKEEERAMLRRSVLLYEFTEENADGIVDFLLEQAQAGVAPAQVIQVVQESI